jgi:predicted CopG family antitoxin
LVKLDPNRYKHIVVSVENYRWLKDLGRTADSFDDVITELRQANTTKNLQGPQISTPAAQAAESTTPQNTQEPQQLTNLRGMTTHTGDCDAQEMQTSNDK